MCKTGSAVIAAAFALALVANAAGATPYPCRILDTRTYDGYTLGPLPAGQTWSFSLGKEGAARPQPPPGARFLSVHGVTTGLGYRIRAFTIYAREQDRLF